MRCTHDYKCFLLFFQINKKKHIKAKSSDSVSLSVWNKKKKEKIIDFNRSFISFFNHYRFIRKQRRAKKGIKLFFSSPVIWQKTKNNGSGVKCFLWGVFFRTNRERLEWPWLWKMNSSTKYISSEQIYKTIIIYIKIAQFEIEEKVKILFLFLRY